jgi:hypothetical protein
MFRETKRKIEHERVMSNNNVARKSPAEYILVLRLVDAFGLLLVVLALFEVLLLLLLQAAGGTASSCGTFATSLRSRSGKSLVSPKSI